MALVRIHHVLARGAHALIAGIVLSIALFGQEQGSNALAKRPYFEDPVLHDQLIRILEHMDGFNADSSMFWISKAMLHINAERDQEELYYLLTYRAEVLYYEGLFNEAMKDLDRSMRIVSPVNDSLLIANVYNLKGMLHENIQDSREALPHMRAALSWFPVEPASRYPVSELHHIHGNLGSYLMMQGMLDSAGYHLHKSLELAIAAHAARATAVANWSLGNLAMRQAEPDSALVRFERTIEVARAANDLDIMLDGYSGLAEAHAELGMTEKALHDLEIGELHAKANSHAIGLVTRRNFARRASSLFRSLGDPEKALIAISEWHNMDSSITTRNTLTALRTQAELLRSDGDLALEKARIELVATDLQRVRTTRTIIIVAATLLLLALGGLVLVNASRRRKEKQLSELEMNRLHQDALIAEFRVREQVGRDMHDDLGAGLSALKLKSEMALRTTADPDQKRFLTSLSSTAGDLINSMRQIIWALSLDQGTVEDLVVYTGNYARNYLDENGIRVEVNKPPRWPDMQLTAEQRRSLFLVAKEALHNIVKHSQASVVVLTFSYDAGLKLSIVDDGIGLPVNANLGTGNGIRNMARRMESVNGTLQLNAVPGSAMRPEGTRVELFMPFIPNESSIA